MKFFVISDNTDTQTGMRLTGIDGVVVHEFEETKAAILEAAARDDIAVLLITENLVRLCKDTVYKLKRESKTKLVLEIPDRHGHRSEDAIAAYVREAIGIKI